MFGFQLTRRTVAAAIAVALPLGSAVFVTQTDPDPGQPVPEAAAVTQRMLVVGASPFAHSIRSELGVEGTGQADLDAFAESLNQLRTENRLRPIPVDNFRYDPCLEQRLFWMAEDPSTNVLSAWGHLGSERSDGVPSVGCDGNLAGGLNDTGARVAVKWWNSASHRESLYKPEYSGSLASVCIYFAMTHGGVPDEPTVLSRASARWGGC